MQRPRSFWDTVLAQSSVSASSTSTADNVRAHTFTSVGIRSCDAAALQCCRVSMQKPLPVTMFKAGIQQPKKNDGSQVPSLTSPPSIKETLQQSFELTTPFVRQFATHSSLPETKFPHLSPTMSPLSLSSPLPLAGTFSKAGDPSVCGPPGPQVCTACGVSFLRLSHLRLHVRAVHHALKPFRCAACPASFCHVSSKYRHYRTVHLRRRDFSCARCGQAFAERSAVQKHCRTVHEGSRPYPCPKCGFRFHFKIHLAQHITTVHDKLRPHACKLCNAMFGQRSSLNRHTRQIHGVPMSKVVVPSEGV